MLKVETRTDLGKVRDINEDAVLADLETGLVAIADGMGGHNAGEVASKMALESVLQFVRRSAGSQDFTWPFGVNPSMSLTANRLMTAVKVANRRVYRESESRPNYTGMGTTLIAALAEDSKLSFASVGDSRIYEMKDGTLRRLSKDDSWVALLSSQSGSDESAYKNHPLRNVLTNVIGARPEMDVSVTEVDLTTQTIMMCTDGLHGAVPEPSIAQILRDNLDLAQAAEQLLQAALAGDARDNITLLLARYEATPEDTQKSEAKTEKLEISSEKH
jgi:protein phosphatase